MTPMFRYMFDVVCWTALVLVLVYFKEYGWALFLGVCGAFYLAVVFRILLGWLNGDGTFDRRPPQR